MTETRAIGKNQELKKKVLNPRIGPNGEKWGEWPFSVGFESPRHEFQFPLAERSSHRMSSWAWPLLWGKLPPVRATTEEREVLTPPPVQSSYASPVLATLAYGRLRQQSKLILDPGGLHQRPPSNGLPSNIQGVTPTFHLGLGSCIAQFPAYLCTHPPPNTRYHFYPLSLGFLFLAQLDLNLFAHNSPFLRKHYMESSFIILFMNLM